ncbi:MAG: hypothetical protein AB7E37_07465 [Candidatus Altimarinota bacterium]|uniref:Membrane protein n=1 Tax=Arcobacter defluvii TaxID=873191 RepID=A0AAE7BHJ4_9BACT|nr:hypothetical protein [Arcobacter defluvii]QKF78102.1 putative membrane protein [Arcobacter defluvii]RXI33212.1 hypothetical protein CP964_06465 [Arcobacter defluvii]
MEITESFIRQRRNLLLTSIVLFLINFAGIEIPDKLIIATNEYKIEDPIIIYMFMWTMLFYFLWRYFQYYNELLTKHKEYNFFIYPISSLPEELYFDFKNINLFYVISFFWSIIKILFISFSNFLSSIISSIFNKNITETLLPFIFAIFVIFSSTQTPYYKNKEIEISKKLELVENKIWNEPILKIKHEINNYFTIKIFDIESSQKIDNCNTN